MLHIQAERLLNTEQTPGTHQDRQFRNWSFTKLDNIAGVHIIGKPVRKRFRAERRRPIKAEKSVRTEECERSETPMLRSNETSDLLSQKDLDRPRERG